jgi:hypothetical protein
MDQGFIDIAGSNGTVFTNALENDMVIYTAYPTYSILLGTTPYQPSSVEINQHNVIVHAPLSMKKGLIQFDNGAYISASNSTQSIGIGTSNPGSLYHLDVNGSIHASGQYYHQGKEGRIWYTSPDNSCLFWPSNIAVNTSNPTEDYALDVNGAARFTSNYVIDGQVLRGLNVASNNNLYTLRWIGVNTSNPQYPVDIFGNLNVTGGIYQSNLPIRTSYLAPNQRDAYFEHQLGIGLSNPAYRLDVMGTMNVSGQMHQNGIPAQSWVISSANSNFIYHHSNVGIMNSNPAYALDVNGRINATNGYFEQGGLRRMWAANTQNSNAAFLWSPVGIMTSNPAYSLDVNGDINIVNALRHRGIPMRGWQTSTITNALYWNSNVGIGTSNPLYPLEVSGALAVSGDMVIARQLNSTVNMNAALILKDSNNGLLREGSNTVLTSTLSNVVLRTSRDVLTVTNDGKVGIGITIPSALLHVQNATASASTPQCIIQNVSTSNNALTLFELRNAQDAAAQFSLSACNLLTIANPSIDNTGNIRFITSSNPIFIGMQITPSNVGINTSSPQDLFEVYNGNIAVRASNQICAFTSTLERNNMEVSTMNLGIVNLDGQMILNSKQGDTVLQSSFNNSIRLAAGVGPANIKINSNNFLGICTEHALKPIHVTGEALVQGVLSITSSNSTNVGGTISFANNASTISSDIVTNDLIIGTTAPSSRIIMRPQSQIMLESSSVNVRGTGNNGFLTMQNFSQSLQSLWGIEPFSGGGVQNIFGGGTTSSSPLVLYTQCNERFRIQPNGNIGVAHNSPTSPLQFATTFANRKVTLYDANALGNDHQCYAFGVGSNGILRYQVPSAGSHVFYGGVTSNNSWEVLRISSSGQIGVNMPSSNVNGVMQWCSSSNGHQQSNNVLLEVGPVSALNFNGYMGPSNVRQRIDNSKRAWRIVSNQSGNNDTLSIDAFTGTGVHTFIQCADSNVVLRNFVKVVSPDNTSTLLTEASSGGASADISTANYLLALDRDSAFKPGTATWTVGSDARIKEHISIADTEKCYNTIKQLELMEFNFKPGYGESPSKRKLGWIAQDVQQHIPEAVNEHAMFGFDDFKTLSSDHIYATMYGCIKHLQKQVEHLQSRLDRMDKSAE